MNASRTRLNCSAHVPWISTSGWCRPSIAGSAASCSSVLVSAIFGGEADGRG
jgi:hypothetical protein